MSFPRLIHLQKQDIVVANDVDDSVSILLGDGTGGFDNLGNFMVGDSPSSVAIGDFNNDGRPDLVVANWDSADISILMNRFLK